MRSVLLKNDNWFVEKHLLRFVENMSNVPCIFYHYMLKKQVCIWLL